MTVAPQADTEVVTGIVQGIVQKAADKWQIEVNIGQQNPRRLWTKDADLVQQMMGLIGQQRERSCAASRTGRTTRTSPSARSGSTGRARGSARRRGPGLPPRAYARPHAAARAAAGSGRSPPGQQPVPAAAAGPAASSAAGRPRAEDPPADGDEGGSRSAASYLEPEQQTFDSLISISERLVAYYENGVAWPQQEQGWRRGPRHADDDIPF